MESAVAVPADARLQLLAEGAANIVYRIVLQPGGHDDPPVSSDLLSAVPADSSSTPPPTDVDLPPLESAGERLHGKLLRLRKALPWTSAIAALHSHIHRTIFPLFDPSQLVAHDLATLPSGLVAECNAQLRASEQAGARPEKRHGVYLAPDELHGMLVTDMAADDAAGEVLVEVKPKWLAQSPTAPRRATRCRTCALREMRQAKTLQQGHARDDVGDFCPLDLASMDRASVEKAVTSLLERSTMTARLTATLKPRLTTYFMSSSILSRLAQLQRQLDPVGILQTSSVTQNVCIAMTLRDCTLFLKVPSNNAEPVEARLGDLDIKNADAEKLEYWQRTEKDLIQGGWYEGGLNQGQKSVCRLSR